MSNSMTPNPAPPEMPDDLRELNALGMRECFADSERGLRACVVFDLLATEHVRNALRKAELDKVAEALKAMRQELQDDWLAYMSHEDFNKNPLIVDADQALTIINGMRGV